MIKNMAQTHSLRYNVEAIGCPGRELGSFLLLYNEQVMNEAERYFREE